MIPFAFGIVGVPKGAIVPYEGLLSAIPSGFHICDGTGGTPDLRDTFVRGAANGANSGATGGEDAHALTEAELAAHTHGNVPYYAGNNADASQGGELCDFDIDLTGVTSSTGSGNPHNNIPVYFALLWIKRI